MESKITVIHEAFRSLLISDTIVPVSGVKNITTYVNAANIGLDHSIPGEIASSITYHANHSTADINLPTGEFYLNVNVMVPEKISAAQDVRDAIVARIDYLMSPAAINLKTDKNLRCRLIQRIIGTPTYDSLVQVYEYLISYRMICDNEIMECPN